MIAPLFALLLALQPPSDRDLLKLVWMSGCWTDGGTTQLIDEQWMAPGGGIMMGMTRTVQEGRTTSYEFVRIAPMLSGVLSYSVTPSGGATVTFPVKSIGDGEVVFENLARDFPQRIIYRRGAGGTLQSRIEGVSQGRPVSQDFTYKACPRR